MPMDGNENRDVPGSPLSPEMNRNPSPPPEGDTEPDGDADAIGETVFSKHWLFSTLTRLVQMVTQQDSVGGDEPQELANEHEEELCKVWDMAMNKDVAGLLQDFKAADILLGVITKSHSPRLTEICVGILGNMACFHDTCMSISQNDELGAVLLLLLGDSDPPTLLETCRLLLTCVSQSDAAPLWLERIRQHVAARNSLCFIMRSSTNVDLLVRVGELVDKLMDEDEELMKSWLCESSTESQEHEDLAASLLEAATLIRKENPHSLEVYLHALQLLTTVDEGMQNLMSDIGCGDAVFNMVSDLVCEDLCQPGDPALILLEQKAVLAPGLALLCALSPSYQDISATLVASLLRILHCHGETQKGRTNEKREAGQRETPREEDQDVQLQVVAEMAAELLSTIFTDLPKDLVSELIKIDHLTKNIFVSALKKLLPQYDASVQCLIRVLSEVEPKLADIIKKECSITSQSPRKEPDKISSTR